MPESKTKFATPNAVRDLLADLRRRIRWYVLVEGAAVLTIWIGVAFWLALAIDYLPVLVGANEMPRGARVCLLLIVAAVAVGLAYRYILRRVFHKFHDASLALLIERQFPSFRDSLVTTVENSNETGEVLRMASAGSDILADVVGLPTNREMLARTIDSAAAQVSEVKLTRVFSFRPLLAKLGGAVIVLTSFVLLGVFASEALSTGISRLFLLSRDPWPRRAKIEMVGFESGQKKVAKGSDLILRVRADSTREVAPPEVCTILYETADGDRGRVNMSRDGEPREGFQHYVFNGKPFKSMLDDIHFDVIGYDHRLRDQRINVVDSPVVVSVQLKSELPTYTDLLPREETWTPGTQLPIGSQVFATIQTSKSLQSAVITNIDTDEQRTLNFAETTIGAGGTQFLYDIPKLEGRHAVTILLTDTDGIESTEPFLLTIGAVSDDVPNVDITLRGIGSSITAIAQLPIEGRVRDDYGLARSWFDIRWEDAGREFDFSVPNEESFDRVLDLRDESASEKEKPLALKPQDRITFSIKAQDKYDLAGETHVGTSDPIVLTVVRPDELLAILDGRELGLRRRFEQIRGEVAQTRDTLLRLRGSWDEKTPNSDDSGVEANAETAEQNLEDLRVRWTQWSAQKTDQSTQEVGGVAVAFEDIREELINNRVDTPERKSRLEDQIIVPLRTIADEMFPELNQTLANLQTALPNPPAAEPQAKLVVTQTERILVAMDDVLQKMLELEDYAELVNIVRSIIQDQATLEEKTKEEQKRRVLDFLK